MNLPHGEALRFAKEVIKIDTDTATVLCEFREIPTLPMFIEAAAQSTAAFAPSGEALIGFLVMSREIKLLTPLREKSYHFKITREAEIGTMKKFFFEAFDRQESVRYVSGSLTIVIEDITAPR